MRKRSLLLALLLATALAACGGGDGGETSATTAPSAERPANEHSERGGEASIEGFGVEASGEEREEIEGAFEGYLTALAAGDYEAACSYLVADVTRSLAQFAGEGSASCSAALPTLLAPSAGEVAAEQADGEITGIRVEGDNSFVVFRAPGAELYNMTMVREGGGWKVGSVAASILVPDL